MVKLPRVLMVVMFVMASTSLLQGADQEPPAAKVKSVRRPCYVCDKCQAVAMKPGKCDKCGVEMTEKHLLLVKDNIAYLCACGGGCKCEMKGDDTSKCGCGDPVLKIDLKGMPQEVTKAMVGMFPPKNSPEKQKACGYCGMQLDQYGHSRILITNEDGSEAGLCSLHCAAVDAAVNIDKTPKLVQVGDYNAKKLINAENAAWVLGGNKPGVMSKRGKWAFENKTDAEAFVKDNGGSIAGFDDAMKAAYEDMYADTKMIREKRKMKKKSCCEH